MTAYALAVLAACANAVANVLQRRADRDQPPDLAMRPRLLLVLLRHPVWLAGMGLTIASFLLMATALGLGRLSAIQPIVVIELPLTLVGAAVIFGARMTRRDWLASGAVTLGVAGLVGFLAPDGGSGGRASGLEWVLASSAAGAVVAVLVVAAVTRTETGVDARRPALLGVAAGVSFAASAAYMKGMTAAYDRGIVGILGAWQTYAMVVAGVVGIFLIQNAYQSGPLLVAQPGITLTDPTVAIVWGVIVFGEHTRGGVFLLLAALSALVLAGGTVLLARSPLLTVSEPQPRPERRVDIPVGVKRRPPVEAPPALRVHE